MIMDIAIMIIFCGAVFLSMHRGFALTVINFLKGIASVVLGFLFYDNLREYLLDHTAFGARIEEKIADIVADSVSSTLQDSSLYQLLPGIFKSQSDKVTEALTAEWVESTVSTAMGIFSFFLIILAISLISFVLTHLFSKKYRRGFFGFVDWLLGAVMGTILGAFYVFLFLALILPVTGIFVPGLADILSQSLSNSTFAQDLYNNNLLLFLFKIF